jgi:hypothetical protein
MDVPSDHKKIKYKQMKKCCQSIFILLVILLGCTNQQEHEEEINKLTREIEESHKPIKQQVYYRFPSPKDIMTSMQDMDVGFNHEVLLPVDNLPKVVGSINQQLLMGMYFTNFGYSLANKKFNLSREYFENLLELGAETRLTEYMDPNLYQRIEKNYDNVDSLETISDEVYQSIFNYLEVSGSEQTIAMISAGSMIEALHVGIGLMNDCETIPDELSQKLAAQKFTLSNLISFMDDITMNKQTHQVRDTLYEILVLFKRIPVKKSATKVEKEAGSVILSGGETFTITGDLCNKIRDKVDSAREGILASDY